MGRVIARLWVVWWCAMVLGAGWTVVQACDPSTKVEFDPPADSSDVTLLVQIEVPESCGSFQATELMTCEDDLRFEEGCCEPSCKEMLTGIDSTCLGDFARAACDEGLKRTTELLDTLARRCDDDYVPVTCPTDKASGTVNTAEPDKEASGAPKSPFKRPPTPAEDAEACHEETIVAEVKFDPISLFPLASFVLPASCGDFQLVSLVTCMDEIKIVKGCCQEPCKDVLKPVSKKCLEDTTRAICASQSPELISILQRLFRRCHPDPFEVSCSELEALDSAMEASELAGTPEACDPSTKVPFDPPHDASDLVPLMPFEIPASCGSFQVISLWFCQHDALFKEGCCESSCKNVFVNINATCLTDFARAVCDEGGKKGKKAIKILDILARRCDDDYVPFSCSVVRP